MCNKTNNDLKYPNIYISDSSFQKAADELASHLGSKVISSMPEDNSLVLVFDSNGLSLTDGKLTMQGDFSANIKRLKTAYLREELLVKASKIKNKDCPLTAIDATAGMGEDSLLLAAAGFDVTLFEYNPVIFALLSDTLRRAAMVPELADIVGRMHPIECNSIDALNSTVSTPDIILLDPMFPERTKSALIKKKFQLLQQLESPCANESDLLQAAISLKPHKVIIKRPLKGATLAGMTPSYSITGKSIRYDCLVYA